MPDFYTSKRQLGLRLLLCLEAAAVSFLGLLPDGSSNWWLSCSFGAVATIGLLDILVNDLLDNRYNFRFALKWRNDLYLILAGLHGTTLLSLAKSATLTEHHVHTLLLALACVWVAVFDVRYRYLPRREPSDFQNQSGRA